MSKKTTNISTADAVDSILTSATAAHVSQPDSAPDPFDLNRLRLSTHLNAAVGVKKLLTSVPVKKPSKEWFVRVHADPSFHIQTYVVELKEDSEVYLVDPGLWNGLVYESTFGPRALFTAQSKQGDTFIWPIRLPGPDGRLDDWNRSALEAAQVAMKKWVRVQSNRSLGAYEIYEAAAPWGEPEWPDLQFKDLLKIAFKDRLIDSADHPVLKRLRGEA
jgi:hypothetical protein